MHILIWLYDWTHFSGSMVWLYNICLQVCMRYLPTYELHISLLSCRVRERRQCYYALRQKYHIFWEKREGIHS
jgi:hypothetical protein